MQQFTRNLGVKLFFFSVVAQKAEENENRGTLCVVGQYECESGIIGKKIENFKINLQ